MENFGWEKTKQVLWYCNLLFHAGALEGFEDCCTSRTRGSGRERFQIFDLISGRS